MTNEQFQKVLEHRLEAVKQALPAYKILSGELAWFSRNVEWNGGFNDVNDSGLAFTWAICYLLKQEQALWARDGVAAFAHNLRRLQKVREVLSVKSGEYSFNDDRLHNFKCAANMVLSTESQEVKTRTPAQMALGMALKHFVSVEDLLAGRLKASLERCDEKFTDAINYVILIEACLRENVK